MSAVAFVNSLLNDGVARVAALSEEPTDFAQAIGELDRAARPQMPFDPPAVVEAAATWGLQILYRACQFLTYREVDGETIQKTLALPCPVAPCSSVCYSVDLALRYLPDLLTLTRGIAPGDPLVVALLALARAWPLSSVGTPDLGTLDVSAFIDDLSLRQLYVDRIIERRDLSRLQHPVVRESVAAAIGGFPELAPFLANLPEIGNTARDE